MCGIAGFVDHSPAVGQYNMAAVATGMAGTLASRGPDDSGEWVDRENGIGLAHRRLSIIDLSASGHQPMLSSDGRYVLVYNGELYNFQELRAELEARGQPFRGHSDSEVLLEACAAWGVERAVERCLGMFAFGLWDRHERRLTLGRDRLGIKPLYWARFGQVFLFGSELKALRAHPGFEAQIDHDAVAAFMRFSYIPAPHSVYKKVYKLEPGCLLSVQPRQAPRLQRYWDMRQIARRGAADPLDMSDEEALDQFEEVLGDAVQRRMVADVPLGALLSGGIDSSTIVALMQKHSKRPVQTFTIGFQEADRDESGYAQEIARHLGTEHTQLIVEPRNIFELLPRLPEWYDEPFADISQLPTYLVSHMAQQEVTVALSGDGGDELLSGYTRYFQVARRWRRISRVPRPLRHAVSGAVGAFLPLLEKTLATMPRQTPKLAKKARKIAHTWCLDTADAHNLKSVSRWDEPVSLVVGAKNEPHGIVWDETVANELPDLIMRMQFFDTVTFLPDDILTKVDRASMAVSLEVRVPLLDHRVVEFAWSLPRHMQVRNGQSKWLLRQLLYQYVPRERVERPKTGFSLPLDGWLRGPLRDWAEELLSERSLRAVGLLNPAPVRRKWAEHVSGLYNWKKQLWNVLMLQAWHRQWM